MTEYVYVCRDCRTEVPSHFFYRPQTNGNIIIEYTLEDGEIAETRERMSDGERKHTNCTLLFDYLTNLDAKIYVHRKYVHNSVDKIL